MNYCSLFLILVLSLLSPSTEAQVQVRNEPRHHNVFENKYVRVLDVRLEPKDTTLYHIHSTPSLFTYFTNTTVGIQIKGKDWVKSQNVAGSASYRSFINDTLVHRVSNWDMVLFHVNDIEILSAYNADRRIKPLPYALLFENDKVFAYRLTDTSFNNNIISDRGPIIAQLIGGNEITLQDANKKTAIILKEGGYLYIEPKTAFSFSAMKNRNINLVLFEIK